MWSTVSGEDCLIVASNSANASFELSGKADALKQVGFGSIDAGVKIFAESNVGLSIVGDSGVVGLRLFKLGPWGDQARLLGPEGEAQVETDEADELEDDV